MPKYHVERSIQINSPVASVQALTSDFSEWPKWSPWLCMEPEAKLEMVGAPGTVGHGYSWQGQLTGEGEMRTASIVGGLHQMDLTFLKPFKSTAKVELDLKEQTSGETTVTWTMDSALPFFLFFMTSNVKTMIGMDYERGLKMLKDLAENGSVDSKIDIHGVVDTPDIHYVGVSAESSMADIGTSMEETMPRIYNMAKEGNFTFTDLPVGAIYEHMDLKQQHCRYTAIIPVSEPATASADMTAGTIGAGKSLKVTHTGSYRHLGNAWAAAMSYQRYNKLKPLKSQAAYEIYLNDPTDTPEKDLLTEIYIPLKAYPNLFSTRLTAGT